MKPLIICRILLAGFCTALLFTGCEKPNAPPVPDFTFTPDSGAMDTVFTFDASKSSDDNDCSCSLEVRWDWDADGTWDTGYSKEKVASHRFAKFEDNAVILEVKDTKGLTGTLRKTVSISNTATITGMDPRMCACCGGWWIRIGNNVLRFYDYPASAQPILDNVVFPLPVTVKWAKKSPRCMGDEIIVFDLIKN